jgi:hypothetical protein
MSKIFYQQITFRNTVLCEDEERGRGNPQPKSI